VNHHTRHIKGKKDVESPSHIGPRYEYPMKCYVNKLGNFFFFLDSGIWKIL